MTILKSHIFHPYENHSLTFRDLKDIISNVGLNKYEFYEKFDGINILITWDFNSDELKIARNKTQIKKGGLNLFEIEKEFENKTNIKNCFIEAYKVLNDSFKLIDYKKKINIFGSMGGIWYSVELLNPDIFNTIKYENKSIVFHNLGNSSYDLNGEQLDLNLETPFKLMLDLIPVIDNSASSSEWNILPPNKIIVRPIDENEIKNYVNQINDIERKSQVNSYDSIKTFLFKKIMIETEKFPMIHKTIRNLVVKNILGMPQTFPLKHITSGLDKFVIDQINQMINDINIQKEKIIEPIEKVFFDFSCKILKNLKSHYVGDFQEELSRIKTETNRCIAILQNINDNKTKNILQKNIRKIQNPDNINSVIEGIVFTYKNTLYKLTGFFGCINQICGYVKYNIETIQEPIKQKYDKSSILSMLGKT